MRGLLDKFLRRFIVVGRLTVRWPDGSSTMYVGAPGSDAGMALRDAATVRRIMLNPALAVGEAYMDGGLMPLDCSIYELLDVLVTNHVRSAGVSTLGLRDMLARMTRRLAQFNPASRSRRNVAHHYDLNGRLYSLFLDRDRQYSCGYFSRGETEPYRLPDSPACRRITTLIAPIRSARRSASSRRLMFCASNWARSASKLARLALLARIAFFCGNRKLRAKPGLTLTRSPICPSFSTRWSRISSTAAMMVSPQATM
jgi:hypothetical protein